MNDALLQVQQDLQAHWGLDFYRAGRVVTAMCSPKTVDELVAACGLSHRSVGQIVAALEPLLERDGELVRLSPEHADEARARFAGPLPVDDPWTMLARQDPRLAALTETLASRPRADRDLDHVAATPLTAMKRALYLSQRFDLRRATVLMLGDHDMTAVALAHVVPDIDLVVVDIDERLLGYIAELSRARGWRIRTRFADLRVELPPSLLGQCDLVFTDPPYNPEGVGLFLRRGIQALRDGEFSRLLLAYGHGEHQRSLGLQVQSVLHSLRLLNEAVLPAFHQYNGAPALGGRSDLYVLRPTRNSAAAARSESARDNIYTRGRRARETNPDALPAALQTHIQGLLGEGARWFGAPPSIEGLSSLPKASVRDYIQGLRSGAREVTGASTAVVSLYPNAAALLPRVCLSASAERLLVCGPQRPLADLLAHPSAERSLIFSRYQLTERRQEGNAAVAILQRRDDAPASPQEAVVREIGRRSRAKLANAWREALVRWAASNDRKLSKNDARRIISATTVGAAYGGCHLTELPLWALQALWDDVAASAGQVLA